jgi:copper chaperone CopZ
MKTLLFAILALWVSLTFADAGRVVTIEVWGMSCPFCVYGVEKSLKRIPGVQSADVDLKAGRARVLMQPGQEPDLERFREAILDAGFTPGKVSTAAGQGEKP